MSVTITSIPKNNHLLINASGSIAGIGELNEFFAQCYREIANQGFTKIIVDERNVAFPQSPEQAIESVDFIFHMLPEEIRSWHIGAVVSDDMKTIADFWEFQANQRGYQIKIFSTVERAGKFLGLN